MRVGERPTGFRRTVVARHSDAPDLRNPVDLAPFPGTVATEDLDPATRDVHRNRVAAIFIHAAEKEHGIRVGLSARW